MKNKSFNKKRLTPTIQHHSQIRNENTLWEDYQEREHNQKDLGGGGDGSSGEPGEWSEPVTCPELQATPNIANDKKNSLPNSVARWSKSYLLICQFNNKSLMSSLLRSTFSLHLKAVILFEKGVANHAARDVNQWSRAS